MRRWRWRQCRSCYVLSAWHASLKWNVVSFSMSSLSVLWAHIWINKCIAIVTVSYSRIIDIRSVVRRTRTRQTISLLLSIGRRQLLCVRTITSHRFDMNFDNQSAHVSQISMEPTIFGFGFHRGTCKLNEWNRNRYQAEPNAVVLRQCCHTKVLLLNGTVVWMDQSSCLMSPSHAFTLSLSLSSTPGRAERVACGMLFLILYVFLMMCDCENAKCHTEASCQSEQTKKGNEHTGLVANTKVS